jgi:putative peptidoglycan lipid II flippase
MLAVYLTRISAGQFLFAALAAVTMAWLHSRNRFAVPAFGAAIVNIILIVTIAWLVSHANLVPIAVMVVLGYVIWWSSQLGQVVWLERKQWRHAWQQPWQISRGLAIRYLQALLAAGLLFLIPSIARALASAIAEGGVAAINYTLKMVELPLGGLISILAVVLLPALSEKCSQGDFEGAETLTRQGLWLIWLLALPITLILSGFGQEFMILLFGWSDMDPEAIAWIGTLVAWGILSLPAKGVATLLLALFHARRNMKTPFIISLGAVFIYVILAYFMHLRWNLQGVVMAGVIVDWLVVTSYFFELKRCYNVSILTPGLRRDAVTVAAAVGLAFLPVMPWLISGTTPIGGLISTLVAMAFTAVAILIPAYQTIPNGKINLQQMIQLWQSK